ncbi:RNA-binding region RNP-1 domain-containing protein [Reticulomyxa filosa]|uniref:RNA-binding region RNP-1 domain-containing protein n=1 Tax=Reticulomyxa filosa TaxID=46433 RepID=X6NL81_RETFI|nr:RNA-binding region RNP-1 domain-containing protein [Reticulomyxa filosa]|eukprot:ETO26673.1 RNA-binding region RNP-1 domain-containing protein [Reticulomyxa filosa]
MIFPVLRESLSTKAGYAVVLMLAAWIGVTSSIVQGTALGFTGLLDVKHSQSCVAGQAMAGVLASFIRILTKSAMSDAASNQSGLVYYILGGVVNILCAVLFLLALRTSFVQHSLREYFVRWYQQELERMKIYGPLRSLSFMSTGDTEKGKEPTANNERDTPILFLRNNTSGRKYNRGLKKKNGSTYAPLKDDHERELAEIDVAYDEERDLDHNGRPFGYSHDKDYYDTDEHEFHYENTQDYDNEGESDNGNDSQNNNDNSNGNNNDNDNNNNNNNNNNNDNEHAHASTNTNAHAHENEYESDNEHELEMENNSPKNHHSHKSTVKQDKPNSERKQRFGVDTSLESTRMSQSVSIPRPIDANQTSQNKSSVSRKVIVYVYMYAVFFIF